MDNSGIYGWFNLVNGKVYIGQSVNINQRKWNHISKLRSNTHNNSHLQFAFNLYREDNFEFRILEIVEFPEDFERNKKNYKDYLIPYEQKWIDRYNSANPKYGYNILVVAGSPLGYKRSLESIEKTRLARLGIHHSPETRQKMSKAHEGRIYSPEALRKTHESNIGRKQTAEHLMRVSISNSLYRYIAISPTGSTYIVKSMSDFCKRLSLCQGAMSRIASGKYKFHHGFTARYMTEERED